MKCISICALAITAAIAAPSAAQLPRGKFVDRKAVLPEYTFFMSAVSGDGLTVFLTSDETRPGDFGQEDIWMATRNSVDDVFGEATNLGPTINSIENDGIGSVSADGKTIYFGRGPGGGGFDIYQATRESVGDPFTNVQSISKEVNVADWVENSPRVTADGLSMVFHRVESSVAPHKIWLSTRDSLDEKFGEAVEVSEIGSTTHAWWPSISSDTDTIFYSDWTAHTPARPGGEGHSDIWVMSRDESGSFGEPVNPDRLWPGSSVNTGLYEGAPYISADWPAAGSQIYFSYFSTPTTGGIYQSTWQPDTEHLEFDFDGETTVIDLNILASLVGSNTTDLAYDVNQDGTVDANDVSTWLRDAAYAHGHTSAYLNGDTNLDRIVDAADLNAIGLNWQGSEKAWSEGDFNFDGKVDSADLNALALNWRKSSINGSVRSVPEPSSLLLALFGAVVWLRCLRAKQT